MVELVVKWPIELPESLDGRRIDMRMITALGLAQAVRRGPRLRFEETRKALGGIKVEMLFGDDALQTQKVLDTSDLVGGIHDETLPADEEQLGQREAEKPSLQVAGIDPDLHRTPVGVHHRVGAIDEGQLLEPLHVRLLAGRLGVVGDGPRHRIPHHNQQSGEDYIWKDEYLDTSTSTLLITIFFFQITHLVAGFMW